MKKEDVLSALDSTIGNGAKIFSASMVVDGGEFEVGVRVTPKRYRGERNPERG